MKNHLKELEKHILRKGKCMIDLKRLGTESRHEKTDNLDQMTIEEVINIMNEEDYKCVSAVKKELPQIKLAVEFVIDAFNNGGRLIYIGAGTSGRIGLVDAVECPPTFGTKPEQVVGLIAGGERAFIKAVEGAEDSDELAVEDLKKLSISKNDVIIGLAASGRTPYVIGGLNYAKSKGCKTVAISCNKGSNIGAVADVAIEVVTGPEVLTGSTRLKAGTAQKMIVNMISTASMIGIGKVYKNMMVDLQQTNKKLQVRAENIVMEATGSSREIVRLKLEEAEGSVKLAILMIISNCDVEIGRKRLEEARGHVRKAMK